MLFVDLVNEFKKNYRSSGKSAGSIQNVFGYIDNYIYSSSEKEKGKRVEGK